VLKILVGKSHHVVGVAVPCLAVAGVSPAQSAFGHLGEKG
jgi:hypothetical protein